jgi:hypothetical protein
MLTHPAVPGAVTLHREFAKVMLFPVAISRAVSVPTPLTAIGKKHALKPKRNRESGDHSPSESANVRFVWRLAALIN